MSAAGPVWYPLVEPAVMAERVAAAFEQAYGHEPDGVWAAPGRVNLIGEHVDYNGGLCLPFALPHRTYVALAGRDDDRVRVRSAQMSADDDGAADDVGFDGALADVAPGTVEGWPGTPSGCPGRCGENGFDVPGFDALVDGQVPLGSGLSSSAALECAVAVALDELADLGLGDDDPGRAQLAAACVRAENDIAGAPTGGMDQAASLRSRAGHALLLGLPGLHRRAGALRPARCRAGAARDRHPGAPHPGRRAVRLPPAVLRGGGPAARRHLAA